MIVQVVTEVLDMTDGGLCDGGIGEMTREKNERNIADIFCLLQAGKVSKLEGRITRSVKHLRCALNSWESPCVNEFLQRNNKD